MQGHFTAKVTHAFFSLDFLVDAAKFLEIFEVQLDHALHFLVVVLRELTHETLALRPGCVGQERRQNRHDVL